MKTGYKEMLRNRVPLVVDIALKYCKAKDRWINHVYDNYIKMFVEKNDRKHVTRILLGIQKGKSKNFNFHNTIFWDQFGLSNDEIKYWNWVESWVNWFEKTYLYIENAYNIDHISGKYNKSSFKTYINEKYLSSMNESDKNKLSDYIIRMLEETNK